MRTKSIVPPLACSLVAAVIAINSACAETRFFLPTPNDAIFETGAESVFFAPTPGKEWSSGSFGCVRSEGWRFHEGIDILKTATDARGEPTDAIYATTDGIVAYINGTTGRSNYGKYIVLEHNVDGFRLYSLYAHVSASAPGLQRGDRVRGGQRIGTMGRTAPIRPPITRDRAHLHFEIGLILTDNYGEFLESEYPSTNNYHGMWNGLNLSGLNPRDFFSERRRLGARFDLKKFIQDQDPMFQVIVPTTDFFFARQYPQLIRPNPNTRREAAVAMEIKFNYHGLPFEMIPRSRSEVGDLQSSKLVGLDQAIAASQKCCKFAHTNRSELRSAAWRRVEQMIFKSGQSE